MHGFKMYSMVLTVLTFDTVYRLVIMHLMLVVEQVGKNKEAKTKLEIVGCVKEQVDLVQRGFGCYLLSQFTFLTFNFILQSYDFLILWMANNSFSTMIKFYLYQAGLLTIIMSNLLKMVMIAYSSELLKAGSDSIRQSLAEEREISENEKLVKVGKDDIYQYFGTPSFC